MPISTADIQSVASEVFSLLGTGRQTPQFSVRDENFGIAEAYSVTPLVRRLREERGERVIGRKIGFTNRTIWEEYDIYAPIWGYMYEKTTLDVSAVGDGFSLHGLAEPRIEPEIALHLAKAPAPGMNEAELLGCVDWIAHGFEVVQSLFAGWKVAPADTIAGLGMHAAYLTGPRHAVGDRHDAWLKALANFDIELHCNGKLAARGHSSDVLGGPLSALRHLNDLLAEDSHNPPLAAGELITTGTLTTALLAAKGETWSTVLSGIELEGISVSLTG